MRLIIRGLLLLAVFSMDSANAALDAPVLYMDPISSTMKFNALLQGWGLAQLNPSPNDQRLRLRRAELKVSGNVDKPVRYFFMIDPARLVPEKNGKRPANSSVIFQDFGVSVSFGAGFDFTAGQFKIPAAAEALESSSEVPLPERSAVTRAYGDFREMGFRLAYRRKEWSAMSMVSSGRHVSTDGIGFFNDLVNRVDYSAEHWSAGSFLVLGDFEYKSKGRVGMNARFRPGSADLRAEGIVAKNPTAHSYGFTLEPGYWLIPHVFEVLSRFELYTPNSAFPSAGKAETLGMLWNCPDQNLKFRASWTTMQNMSARNGSPAFSSGAHNTTLLLAAQFAL